MPDETTTKKPRTTSKTAYRVLREDPNSTALNGPQGYVLHSPPGMVFADTQDAKTWLKKPGHHTEGTTYLIVGVRWHGLVTVSKKEIVKLSS